MYHHFIMMDDVDTVGENPADGSPLPLSSTGQPSMICEFSNTPERAAKTLLHKGNLSEAPCLSIFSNSEAPLIETLLQATWLMMAPFHKLPLGDYTSTAGIQGIFRVREKLTEEERTQICVDAEKLTTSYRPYNLIWRNCESAAFALSPHSRRWMSPEVPMVLWNLVRWLLAVVGVFFLQRMKRSTTTGYKGYTFLYHMFVTTPVALQALIQLVRASVNLTEKRRDLGERSNPNP